MRLVGLTNDVSLRNLIPGELAKGFGFFQSKPASAFSPVFVTPDALGGWWREGKLHRKLMVDLNGQPFETHRVMRAFAAGKELEAEAARQAMWCCECGICELMACPMGLSPRRINIAVKNSLRGNQSPPAEAGACQARAFAEYRMMPTARLAARVGLQPYLAAVPQWVEVPAPVRVRIPLKQHIGAPAVPVVQTGDMVRLGDLLGEIPEGALGARVHAGITGRVTVENDAVVIERSPA